jgi:hypothetical protein
MKKLFCVLALMSCAAFSAEAQRTARDAGGRPAPAATRIPNPVLFWRSLDVNAKGSDGKPYVGINLGVSNYPQFPAALFAPAPELPACGANKSASRTWLRVFDAKTGKAIYSYCAMASPTDLRTFSFNVARAELPAEVYVALEDRAGKKTYWSNCLKTADGKPCDAPAIEVGGATMTVIPVGSPLAFHTVLGRMPNAQEAAQWDAEKMSKKWGQDKLNQALLEWLTTAPDAAKVAEIKQAVGRAFKAAGKGAPSQQEMDYWTNRIVMRMAYYQIILDALKNQ